MTDDYECRRLTTVEPDAVLGERAVARRAFMRCSGCYFSIAYPQRPGSSPQKSHSARNPFRNVIQKLFQRLASRVQPPLRPPGNRGWAHRLRTRRQDLHPRLQRHLASHGAGPERACRLRSLRPRPRKAGTRLRKPARARCRPRLAGVTPRARSILRADANDRCLHGARPRASANRHLMGLRAPRVEAPASLVATAQWPVGVLCADTLNVGS